MKHLKNIIFIIILITFNLSCNFNQETNQKELELKQKELDLKERELNLLENKNENTEKLSKKKIIKKELVYLYTANGGMVGYFNDGSVVGCPRCDFCKSNILAMHNKESSETWNLKKPNDFVSYEEDNGWVLINYKWQEKVPQF